MSVPTRSRKSSSPAPTAAGTGGEFVPVSKSLPTLYDVCELSGVSSATVSRVFSGNTPVSEERRRRVLEAAKSLGYVPSHAGRALRSRRTQTLGAIFPEMARHFYPDLLAGIDEVASDSGFDVLACLVGKKRRKSELVDRLLGQGRVDALILLNLQNRPGLSGDVLDSLPIVLIGRGIPGSSLPVVGMDNVGGACAMIEHLHAQGHRKIAVLTGPAGNYDSEQRLLGCRKAFAQLDLKQNPRLIWQGEFTFASGIAAAREVVAGKVPRPDAVFCLNDAMAIGMMGELRSAGLSVPGDIALGGFDDVHESRHLSLTTITVPTREMGQKAARFTLDFINNNQRPTSQQMPVRLVVRDSSAASARRT